MSLQDTDIFIVERSGTQYKSPTTDIAAYSGVKKDGSDIVNATNGDDLALKDGSGSVTIRLDPGTGDITATTFTGQLVGTADAVNVSVDAGQGLVGGGSLDTNRTFDVGAGLGITVSTNAVAVTAFNGITVDINGVSVTPSNGITVDGSGVAVDAYNGITVDSNGVSVNGSDGLTVTSSGVSVDGGDGIIVDGNGVRVNPHDGISVSSSGVTVVGQNGINVNSSGVFIDFGSLSTLP